LTKAEYISYIKNLLPKVDQTNKYHDNVVAMAITTAQEQLFNELFRKGELGDMTHYNHRYTGTKEAATETGWQKIDFSTMGASPISLERKNGGITRIVNTGAVSYSCKPITHQEYSQMDADTLAYYNDVIWYIVEPDRILLYDDGLLLQFVSTFNVYMIPKFYDLTSTQMFNFPRGFGHRMTQYALEALGVVPPKDLVTDNSDM